MPDARYPASAITSVRLAATGSTGWLGSGDSSVNPPGVEGSLGRDPRIPLRDERDQLLTRHLFRHGHPKIKLRPGNPQP
jgi:hypothetical protein